MYDVLIADDEEHVHLEIEHLIAEIPWVKEIYFANNGIDALAAITEKQPKVVFLDIDMPGLDGIKLGQVISKMLNPPYIMYVTAYDKYALDAFKVNAVAYLLKPIDSVEFKSKIRHLEKSIFGEEETILESNDDNYAKKINCKVDDGYVFFEQKDIVLAYAKDRKVFLHSKGKIENYGGTLSSLEKKLDSKHFMRCHRNFIVNIDYLEEVSSWFNGTYILKVKGIEDLNVIVSRNYLKTFKKRMSLE